MSVSLRYGLAAAALVAVITAALWPFLQPADRSGVLIAAAIALPVQVIAFAFLVHFRGKVKGFMAAWAGGMAARALVVAGVAFLAIRSGSENLVPMLLALAGFFFGLLLLEPVYFRPEQSETA